MKLTGLAAGVLLAVCVHGAAAVVRSSPTFPWDSMWNDGKAEIVTYATSGGATAGLDARVILRKREIVGDGAKPYEAFEMIVNRDALAGVDTVRERMTILFDRERVRPYDLILSGGPNSIHARAYASELQYEWRSATRVRSLSLPWDAGAVFYDALPAWLRGLDLASPARDSVRMLPAQFSSGDPDTGPIPAEIQVVGPAGGPSVTSRGGLEVDVRYQGKTDRMWFHPGPGHPLLVWERADGATLTLKKIEHRVYDEKPE